MRVIYDAKFVDVPDDVYVMHKAPDLVELACCAAWDKYGDRPDQVAIERTVIHGRKYWVNRAGWDEPKVIVLGLDDTAQEALMMREDAINGLEKSIERLRNENENLEKRLSVQINRMQRFRSMRWYRRVLAAIRLNF